MASANTMEFTDANFEAEVLKASMPVLVDFSATWCGPCKKLEPLIQELAGEYENRVKVVKVDVDKAPQIAARFGVMSVPTLLIFRDGTVADQMVGLLPKRTIADKVDKVL